MIIDIDSIKRKLLIKYPFFGSIVANSKFIESSVIQTAATDGENIYYNQNFVSKLTENEQVFLFAHEVCHVAFDHIFRSEGKDSEIWNIATDAVINALLKQDGLSLIEGGINIPEAINYDAEEMYKKLLEEKQKQSKSNQGKSQNKDEHSNQMSQDKNNEQSDDNQEQNSQKAQQNQNNRPGSHDLWKEAIARKKQQESKTEKPTSSSTIEETQEEKSSLFDKIFNRNKKEKSEPDKEKQEQVSREEQKKHDEQIKRLTNLGEKKTFKQNKIERKKQLEELRKALAEQSHGAGRGTNSEIRKINDIGIASPLIDWRRLLKEAVKYDIDWSYRNATIEDGVVTPYLEEIPQPETEIVLDTSGSIDETLLRNFLRECKNILQTSKVKVGYFDDIFYGFTEIKNEYDIDNMRFRGGGGTNFSAAINAFSRRVENKIIFTDGDAHMPDIFLDAIWVVFGEKKIYPKGGKVIYINEEQLKKLHNFAVNDELKPKTR